ncbi:hypothetical protein NQ314_015019 [Rhamnusium bicolor]|uniref:PiggyBac transposable element-derived protein domain-containing protein n=1 Tax=Rhamnusium bicolor TaxID=1586634 RepID=A0AAV8X0H4_9CUCU|nr:hypothetical protein NQ314_015019 [Rhamnusium bicolor]
MTRGDIDYRVSKMDVTYCKWHDNKVVHLICNYHGTNSTTVKRMQKDGSRKDIACPEIVPDYNRYMGGVDRADRLRQAYCINRRSKKMTMIPEDKVSLLEFRRGVSLGLMSHENAAIKRSGISGARNSPRSSPYDTPTILE